MSTSIRELARNLGHPLPDLSHPLGAYVPTVRVGGLLFISGQVSIEGEGKGFFGSVGGTLGMAEGTEAAALCARKILSVIAGETGDDITRLRRLVRLGVFVNCVPGFSNHAAVANGASALINAVLGDKGAHVRTAVGAVSLPRDAAVEIEAVVELTAD